MLIFIIFMSFLVLGVILWICGRCKLKTDMVELGQIIVGVFGLFMIFFFVILAPCRICNVEKYKKMKVQKEVLEYKIRKSNGFIDDESLYKEIIEFNEEIENQKYVVNSPWINCFGSERIANMEKIDV